ncbi:MAG TPA: hypothetical protein VK177_05645, partial [Flavobacteriales bacterium]|nr:hypothetical protein [Flavobacteriales bacterium]
SLLTLVLFIRASAGYKKVLWLVLGSWLVLHGILSYFGFYLENMMSLPPRFGLLLGPPLLAIIVTASTKGGRKFIDQLNPVGLAVMNSVRVPVEFTLLWLFMLGLVPETLTFEGRNFDIVSGATAPLVAWLMYRQKASKGLLLGWNLLCLGLVLNVVIHGILSAPSPFQQMNFDHPNIGVFLFPFSWLPGFIVPLVLFSHIAGIIKLYRKTQV